MNNGIEFSGIENIISRIDDLYNEEETKQRLTKACLYVEAEARKKARKVTGDLRDSIKNKVDDMGGELVGVIFSPLEYAPYVEFGTGIFAESGGRLDVPWNYQDDEGEWHSTSGMKPMPFLRPALQESREKVKEILKGG